jgi:hypothetical protein
MKMVVYRIEDLLDGIWQVMYRGEYAYCDCF